MFSLTWFELSIAIKQSICLFVKGFTVGEMLFCLCQFTDQTEFSVKLSCLHTIVELGKRNAFLNFTHVVVFGDPLVGKILRRFWAFDKSKWSLMPLFIGFLRWLLTQFSRSIRCNLFFLLLDFCTILRLDYLLILVDFFTFLYVTCRSFLTLLNIRIWLCSRRNAMPCCLPNHCLINFIAAITVVVKAESDCTSVNR